MLPTCEYEAHFMVFTCPKRTLLLCIYSCMLGNPVCSAATFAQNQKLKVRISSVFHGSRENHIKGNINKPKKHARNEQLYPRLSSRSFMSHSNASHRNARRCEFTVTMTENKLSAGPFTKKTKTTQNNQTTETKTNTM